jgi:hypothetical protein
MARVAEVREAAELLARINEVLTDYGFRVKQEGYEGEVYLTDAENLSVGVRVTFEDGLFGMVVNY